MSYPKAQPGVTADESSLNQPGSAKEFGRSLTDTARYFDVWLETLKPSLALETTVTHSREAAPARVASEDNNGNGFTFAGTLRVDCYIRGIIPSRDGTLIVGETAEVEADIFVATAIIEGLVRGDIWASERVELRSNARVIGNIETPSLSIQPGAMFEGQCHFLSRLYKSRADENAWTPDDAERAISASQEFSAGTEEDEVESVAIAAGR